MPDITSLVPPKTDQPSPQQLPARGVVVAAPATLADATIRVVVPSHSVDYGADLRWVRQGTSLPQPGVDCKVMYDETGEGIVVWWASIWPGISGGMNAVQSPDTGIEAVQSVTSTTYVDLADYSVTLTTFGGPVMLTASVRVGAVVTGAGLLTFGIDGSADVASAADGIVVVGTSNIPVTVSWLATGLPAGPHTFKVRGRVTAGSMAITHGRRERVQAVELR